MKNVISSFILGRKTTVESAKAMTTWCNCTHHRHYKLNLDWLRCYLSHWKTSLADIESNVMLSWNKCSYYIQSWRGRSNWGSYSWTENWCFSFPGTQEINFVGPAVSAATIPLLARTTKIITLGILHPSSGLWRMGGVVRWSQITRSPCAFQSFVHRTLTVLSPLDDVATGIGNSYFSSIQPLPHPPRSQPASTTVKPG